MDKIIVASLIAIGVIASVHSCDPGPPSTTKIGKTDRQMTLEQRVTELETAVSLLIEARINDLEQARPRPAPKRKEPLFGIY